MPDSIYSVTYAADYVRRANESGDVEALEFWMNELVRNTILSERRHVPALLHELAGMEEAEFRSLLEHHETIVALRRMPDD